MPLQAGSSTTTSANGFPMPEFSPLRCDRDCREGSGRVQGLPNAATPKNKSVVDPFFDSYLGLRPLCKAYAFFLKLRSYVSYTHPHAELDESIKVAALRRLAYDGNLEQLSYIGVMSEAVAIALKEVTGTTEKFKNAIDGLCFENQKATNSFFAEYPALVPSKDAYLLADNSPAKQRSALLAAILPELKRRRKSSRRCRRSAKPHRRASISPGPSWAPRPFQSTQLARPANPH